MPGILNWAIAGLIDLQNTGCFAEPSQAREAKEAYKLDCNPVRSFLIENYEERRGSRKSSSDLYQEYKVFCREEGIQHLSSRSFAAEVKRSFPTVVQDINPTRHNGSRNRLWRNLACRTESSDSDTNDTNVSHLAVSSRSFRENGI